MLRKIIKFVRGQTRNPLTTKQRRIKIISNPLWER